MLSAYLICATPRSGSTMLCDLLAQTGVAGNPKSYFRPASISNFCRRLGLPSCDGETYDRDYMTSALAAARADGDIAGLRTMWNGMAPLLQKLTQFYPDAKSDTDLLTAAFGPTSFLYLEREDQVAQAVSRSRAEQSGLWHRNSDGTTREQNGEGRMPSYDAAAIAGYLAEQAHDNQAWNAWFAANGISPHRINYDALSADPRTSVAGILTALDLDPSRASALAPATMKLADGTSREWADRFRAES